MFYTKSPPKYQTKQEEIQPWNAEESNMLNLIIESVEMQPKYTKNVINHPIEQQKFTPILPGKQPRSYNFCTNLRKYEKKKAEDFLAKKDVNFIQKNIKGISQDFMFLNENSPTVLTNKMIQQKQKKSKFLDNQLQSSIEPINWSVIMWYQENKSEKKQRHKDIQGFLRFQSQKVEKNSSRKKSIQEKVENIEELNKYQGDKYQKLLKLRQSLRKRNLKSASQSRKIVENSLNIEQTSKPNRNKKYESLNKTFTRSIPKTRQSLQQTDNTIKGENFIDSPSNSPKREERFERLIYTSHKNRIPNTKKMSFENSRVKVK